MSPQTTDTYLSSIDPQPAFSQGKESYENMSMLMSELSIYLMFGLGFLIFRYISQLLFKLLGIVLIPEMFKSSNKKQGQNLSDKLLLWLTQKGHRKLLPAGLSREVTVDHYNEYLREQGLEESESPFCFVEKMKEGGVMPDITTYNILLGMCFKDGRVDCAMSLYHCLLSNSTIKMDVVTYNTYIKGMILRYLSGKKDLTLSHVQELLQEMEAKNIKPNVITYNTIIDFCVESSQMAEAWGYFSTMKKKAITPDLFTYSTLIKGIKKSASNEKERDLEKGHVDDLFEAVEEYMRANNACMDEVMLNSLINSAVYFKDIQKVEKTVKYMRHCNLTPSPMTYGVLIKAYGKSQMLDKAFEVFQEMKGRNVEPNEIIYGCLIDCCITENRLVEAASLYSEMLSKKLPINIIIVTMLIKLYTKLKEFAKIWELYTTVAIKKEIQPNIVFFNIILEAVIQFHRFDLLFPVYQSIFSASTESIIIFPDIVTYSTLIKGLCKNQMIQEVLIAFHDMKIYKVSRDEMIYNNVLQGLLVSEHYKECLQIYEEMKQEKIKASNITYSILSKVFSKTGMVDKAVELLDTMSKEGVSPGIVVHTSIIQACIKSKRIDNAIAIFEGIPKRTIEKPDHVLYNTIINGCVYAGKLVPAYTFLMKSMSENIVLANDIYNNVIKNIITYKSWGKNDKVAYAKPVLQFAAESGVEIDPVVLSRINGLMNGELAWKRNNAYYTGATGLRSGAYTTGYYVRKTNTGMGGYGNNYN